MVGETNRAPFDLPEAEGELVGGFHTEYSSLTFALFFLAEYVSLVTVSALATTLFLGGWRAPWPLSIWDQAPTRAGCRWCGSSARCMVFIFVFIWLRGTLPRLRYDQFMKLGWKFLIPVSLLWILAVATLRAANNEGATRVQRGAHRHRRSCRVSSSSPSRGPSLQNAVCARRGGRASSGGSIAPPIRASATTRRLRCPARTTREPVTVSIGASARLTMTAQATPPRVRRA